MTIFDILLWPTHMLPDEAEPLAVLVSLLVLGAQPVSPARPRGARAEARHARAGRGHARPPLPDNSHRSRDNIQCWPCGYLVPLSWSRHWTPPPPPHDLEQADQGSGDLWPLARASEEGFRLKVDRITKCWNTRTGWVSSMKKQAFSGHPHRMIHQRGF